VEGKRVVPYYSRAEIARGAAPVAGKEILWVDDPIEAFFLQIQGSGRIQLDGGETLRLGYADQNGHPFQSIGRYLVERGELQLGEASMPAIKAWAAANPKRLEELLNQNPSFVFFRELPLADPASGPVGALGVPLAPGRSIAVDPRYVPLGAPVFLATTFPASATPLTRLVLGPGAEDSLPICRKAGWRRSYADFLTQGKPLIDRRVTGGRGRRVPAVQHEIVVGLGPVGRAPDGACLVRRLGPKNGVEKRID